MFNCDNPQVVKSPLKNNHVNIKYNKTGEVLKTKKLPIKITIRELHNELIKSPLVGGFNGARSEYGEVVIGDTSLRKYMTPQGGNK